MAIDTTVSRTQNSKSVGDITQSQVMAALLKHGKNVLMPFGDNCRYDLVVEQEGLFFRIQCKTGRMSRGAVVFLWLPRSITEEASVRTTEDR